MDGPKATDDRYVLRRVLGEGGAGRVWLAEDRAHPGSPIALKELVAAQQTEGPESATGLRREFGLLYSLRHPGLAEAYELDLDPPDIEKANENGGSDEPPSRGYSRRG